MLSPAFSPEVRGPTERLVRELGTGLVARGHRPRLITSHPGRPARSVEEGLPVTRHWRPPDGRLVRRSFESHLTHVPFSYASLVAGRYDLAHAFFPTDARAAARWTERTGRPSVLSYMDIPSHASLTARRLRAETTARVVNGCTAVIAPSELAAEAFRRWLGVEPRVIDPGVGAERFGEAYELLYRELLER